MKRIGQMRIEISLWNSEDKIFFGLSWIRYINRSLKMFQYIYYSRLLKFFSQNISSRWSISSQAFLTVCQFSCWKSMKKIYIYIYKHTVLYLCRSNVIRKHCFFWNSRYNFLFFFLFYIQQCTQFKIYRLCLIL